MCGQLMAGRIFGADEYRHRQHAQNLDGANHDRELAILRRTLCYGWPTWACGEPIYANQLLGLPSWQNVFRKLGSFGQITSLEDSELLRLISTATGGALREVQIIQAVGQVFIHSPAMMDKKGYLNPHTEFVPNGVDYASYAEPAPEPEDLRPHPMPTHWLHWDAQETVGLEPPPATEHGTSPVVLRFCRGP